MSKTLPPHRTLFFLVLDPHCSPQSQPGTLHALAKLRRPHRSQRPAALRGWLLRYWALRAGIHWEVVHRPCGNVWATSVSFMGSNCPRCWFVAKLGGSLGNHGPSEAGAGQKKALRSHCIDPMQLVEATAWGTDKTVTDTESQWHDGNPLTPHFRTMIGKPEFVMLYCWDWWHLCSLNGYLKHSIYRQLTVRHIYAIPPCQKSAP